eukprot:5201503-Amphidinium_carterae.1
MLRRRSVVAGAGEFRETLGIHCWRGVAEDHSYLRHFLGECRGVGQISGALFARACEGTPDAAGEAAEAYGGFAAALSLYSGDRLGSGRWFEHCWRLHCCGRYAAL